MVVVFAVQPYTSQAVLLPSIVKEERCLRRIDTQLVTNDRSVAVLVLVRVDRRPALTMKSNLTSIVVSSARAVPRQIPGRCLLDNDLRGSV